MENNTLGIWTPEQVKEVLALHSLQTLLAQPIQPPLVKDFLRIYKGVELCEKKANQIKDGKIMQATHGLVDLARKSKSIKNALVIDLLKDYCIEKADQIKEVNRLRRELDDFKNLLATNPDTKTAIAKLELLNNDVNELLKAISINLELLNQNSSTFSQQDLQESIQEQLELVNQTKDTLQDNYKATKQELRKL